MATFTGYIILEKQMFPASQTIMAPVFQILIIKAPPKTIRKQTTIHDAIIPVTSKLT